MIHLVHMLQRHYPQHAHAIVAALVAALALLLLVGSWVLLQ